MVALVVLVALVGCGRLGFDSTRGDGGADGRGSSSDGADADADAAVDGQTVSCGTTMMCAETTASFIAGASGMVTDDGTGHGDATQGSCGGGGAGDFGVQFTVTPVAIGSVTFQVDAAFDTVLYVFDGMGCGGTELACEDIPGASGETFMLDLLIFPRNVVLVVDGKNGTCGPVTISYGP